MAESSTTAQTHTSETVEDTAMPNESLLAPETVLDDGDSGVSSAQSIDSTRAISDVHNDELDLDKGTNLPTEQELKPELQKFMTACQQGNVHVVKDMIESKTVGANDTFTDGVTGLHWASINNRLDLVKYLVENETSKSDIDVFGGEINATPLHWACRSGLVSMADYLIRAGADPTLKDSQSYNCLHLSVHSSNIMLVIYMLYKFCGPNPTGGKVIYVDEPDDCSRTSLHWACYQGDILSVQALLKFGADVTKTDNTLFTPLHWSFMRAHKPLLKLLVENGADIFVKNDSNKNSFDIARDMDCYKLWCKVLNENFRYEHSGWMPSKPMLSEKAGKTITFLVPYLVLPAIFYFNDFSSGYIIPKLFLTAVSLVPVAFVLRNVIVKSYIPSMSLVKSPLLSGIFSGTFFWVSVVFFVKVLPNTIFKSFWLFVQDILLIGIVAAITYTFYKAMTLNPGMVPVPTDQTKTVEQIDDLVAQGKFNSETFCVHSLVRKPLRSKYSHYRKRLIAKFDHYCPWVYNDVGVRNHKVFMEFTHSLNVGAFMFASVLIAYFKYSSGSNQARGYESDSDDESSTCRFLSGSLCKGFENHNFMFNLLVWTLLQNIWITLLSITQTFQILKGLTSYEFARLMEPARDGSGKNPCFKLLGLDQFLSTLKISILSLLRRDTTHLQINEFEIETDYGMKQNFLDFWFLGEVTWRNLFLLPLQGENNLNGKVVDFYTLYQYPAKKPVDLV